MSCYVIYTNYSNLDPATIKIGYRPNEEPLELGMFQSDGKISLDACTRFTY